MEAAEQEEAERRHAYPHGPRLRGDFARDYSYNHTFPLIATSYSTQRIVRVDDFLPSSEDIDHTMAFKRAWRTICSSKVGGILLVPKNTTYRVKPIKFGGPCRSFFTFKVLGTIEASTNLEDYKGRQDWLLFRNVNNFKVDGGGTIDGKGRLWWSNSCKVNKSKALSFTACNNFTLDGLSLTNAQQMHLTIRRSSYVRALNLDIKAPKNSPNTDGIHISGTRNIHIQNALIGTGDDCISIVDGSKYVQIEDIICGPGHGISIGGLGKGYSKNHVSNIVVRRARLFETSNGVRIKTWQGGSGHAKNIAFYNITMQNVSNPIIIDQQYCDQNKPCTEKKSAVVVDNVLYKNIKGTSATNIAIKLKCDKSRGCKRIVLEDIYLVNHREGKNVTTDCHNVNLTQREFISPKCLPHNDSLIFL
ncbi:hypothetical protein RND81_03G118900 [Saponaria officinalis]|uniref:Polygalacturonase n=1 Tax=Saponaria officinalis TaxID=3572 RepID=A0AAW1MA11_SAPOF